MKTNVKGMMTALMTVKALTWYYDNEQKNALYSNLIIHERRLCDGAVKGHHQDLPGAEVVVAGGARVAAGGWVIHSPW